MEASRAPTALITSEILITVSILLIQKLKCTVRLEFVFLSSDIFFGGLGDTIQYLICAGNSSSAFIL